MRDRTRPVGSLVRVFSILFSLFFPLLSSAGGGAPPPVSVTFGPNIDLSVENYSQAVNQREPTISRRRATRTAASPLPWTVAVPGAWEGLSLWRRAATSPPTRRWLPTRTATSITPISIPPLPPIRRARRRQRTLWWRNRRTAAGRSRASRWLSTAAQL